MFPAMPPWFDEDEDIKGLPVVPFADVVAFEGLCCEFVGDGEEEKVGIFNEFEFAGFVCDKCVGALVLANVGGWADTFVDDKTVEFEETIWDREDVEGCVMGLDTGGFLPQQGGKLDGTEECDVVAVEDVEADAGFVEAVVLELLLLLLPDAAFTVDSWSCISIIWSPKRIVKFNGAFPDRKSTTWKIKMCWEINHKIITYFGISHHIIPIHKLKSEFLQGMWILGIFCIYASNFTNTMQYSSSIHLEKALSLLTENLLSSKELKCVV